MNEKEWLKEIEGHTPKPWCLELAPTRNIFKLLWYCWRCWTITPVSMRAQWGVISGTDAGERVIIALLGPGPHTLENGQLIAGAPVLVEDKEGTP